ncbi:BEL1-like homeodomain protein 6 [Wickerhamomyces ciferrii]|uniref:BEL1-like homeodomain protein 6 n=1 Tax=Wickerhamomyces ciferrii (strain ATCC 14091 / BCRC 22168 / CBS 111 / JCM 3599 / NBRC 0793 / NRRL Y-1031 F-60-10) TaxID=1206466 RepID=K0KRV5_WICCF|nr:BEL1-like homeodomain protein 6 [Wickerhamomyces ciferrii]CCH45861.1 BEL1-like homeodomain protein 6 [Wickerhamomyces ciferrii]
MGKMSSSDSTSTSNSPAIEQIKHEQPEAMTTSTSASFNNQMDSPAASTHSSISSNSIMSGVSLPPIGSILKNIESYQNQQQLNDSQLLLEFNQRNSISDSTDKYTFQNNQHRSESTNSIENFQSELIKNEENINDQQQQQQQQQQQRPINLKTQSQPSIPQISSNFQHYQRPNLPNRKTSSFTKTLQQQQQQQSQAQAQQNQPQPQIKDEESRPATPNLTISTSTISESEDLDSLSREASVDSGIESPGSINSNGQNKKRTNLPRETIEILNEWILNNMDNPYPNHTQKRYLLDKTGLSNVQLSNWFINKRRRRLFSNLSGNNGQPIKKKRLIDRL